MLGVPVWRHPGRESLEEIDLPGIYPRGAAWRFCGTLAVWILSLGRPFRYGRPFSDEKSRFCANPRTLFQPCILTLVQKQAGERLPAACRRRCATTSGGKGARGARKSGKAGNGESPLCVLLSVCVCVPFLTLFGICLGICCASLSMLPLGLLGLFRMPSFCLLSRLCRILSLVSTCFADAFVALG